MTAPADLPAPADADEILALIETLHETEQRLEALTSGEVDTVANRSGRTLVLQRAQEQLRRGEADRLAAILDALPSHVALLDPQGTVIAVNAAWRRFGDCNRFADAGYGVGQNYVDVCELASSRGSRDAGLVAEGLRAVLSGQRRSFSYEYACHSPTEVRWFLMSVTALEGVRLTGTLVMHVDVSDRTAAEQTSRHSTELLQAVADETPDIVYVKDREGRYLLCNRALTQFIGRPIGAILGHDDHHIYPPEQAQTLIDSDRALMATDQPQTTEKWLTGRHGPRLMHANKVAYRDAQGGVIGVIGIARDVTERRRDEQALRELNASLEARVEARTEELRLSRDHAEQANQAKSAFLATMSHEIRTPMNGVIGMIDVLEHTHLRPDQTDIVRTVRESAQALLTIVDDVLDFSKIEAGHFQIEDTPLDLATLVESACDALDALAEGKGIALRMFTDPALPPLVLGDAARLRQVLLNLIGNAIKFSSGQGRPGRISVRACREQPGGGDPVLVLSVADNGIGIDAETLPRLFNPFTQADASTTRRFGGTGLGLSISHRLASLMGGTLQVVSAPGRGSTFRLVWPLRAFEGAAAPVSAAAPMLVGLPCLVYGPERGVTDDLATYLRHGHADVTRESSPDAASAWVDRLLPGRPAVAVIVSDWRKVDSVAPMLAACRGWAARRTGLALRFVVIEQGRRRRPRQQASDVVALDGESMHRAVFTNAVALASGRSPGRPAVHGRARPPGVAEAPGAEASGPLILVAEDNEINQRVLRRQLALLRYRIEVVGDGEAALAAVRAHPGRHALLLTDLHMPLMDGYALAVAVRADEAAAAGVRRRLPIIALTANAMKDEAGRCLALGIDGYMTKPVQLSQLNELLHHWTTALPLAEPAPDEPPEADADAAAEPPAAAPPPADLSVLEGLVGTDAEVVNEVLGLFATGCAVAGASIRQGILEGRVAPVIAAAHQLKSNALSIGALPFGATCAAIESAAESRYLAVLTTLLPRFDAELLALQEFVAGELARRLGTAGGAATR